MFKNIVWRVIKTRPFNRIRPRICHSPVFKLEGKTKRSNYNLEALIFANEATAHYFSKITYSKEPELKNLGKTTYQNIPLIIANTRPDIVFLKISSVFSEYFTSRDFFTLPYVDFVLDISDSWNAIYTRIYRSKRKTIRKIRELECKYEITKNHEKLKSFYSQMYRPHILEKHDKSAEVVSYSESKRLFRRGGLLLVEIQGRLASGAVYVDRGDELYIPLLGTNPPNHALTKDAGSAALFALIMLARQQGYKRLDYGSSKPFLKNGNFLYKKEWGMKIRPMTDKETSLFAIKFCNFEKATIDFMLDNPFIFQDGPNLKGLAILDSDESPNHTYYVPGLSGLVALSPMNDNPKLELEPMQRLSLENNISKVPLPLRYLLKLASQKRYDSYYTSF
jgi:hypothetical protein